MVPGRRRAVNSTARIDYQTAAQDACFALPHDVLTRIVSIDADNEIRRAARILADPGFYMEMCGQRNLTERDRGKTLP